MFEPQPWKSYKKIGQGQKNKGKKEGITGVVGDGLLEGESLERIELKPNLFK